MSPCSVVGSYPAFSPLQRSSARKPPFAVVFCYRYLKDYSLLRFPQTGALSCADFPQLHVLKRGPGHGAATDRPTILFRCKGSNYFGNGRFHLIVVIPAAQAELQELEAELGVALQGTGLGLQDFLQFGFGLLGFNVL